MKLVVQRVLSASVSVNDELVSKIENGLLILVGIGLQDDSENFEYMIKKILKLRIFASEKSFFDKNIQEVGGEVLLVSQFTLYGSCEKGNRPSFDKAMPPAQAKVFYDNFVKAFREQYPKVKNGIFGAYMQVSLVNDGPVTIILER